MALGGNMTPRKVAPLRARDVAVLRSLAFHHTHRERAWARPLDVGGRDWSPHVTILRKLVGRGLVHTRQRGAITRKGKTGRDAWKATAPRGGWRGARVYRINAAGVAALELEGKR